MGNRNAAVLHRGAQVWVCPIPHADVAATRAMLDWSRYVQTAWAVHPRLALGLLGRFPATSSIENELFSLISKNATDPTVQSLPQAAILLATCDPMKRIKVSSKLDLLKHWVPASVSDALGLMAVDISRHSSVKHFIVAFQRETLHRGIPQQSKPRTGISFCAEDSASPVMCVTVGVLPSSIGSGTAQRRRSFFRVPARSEGVAVLDFLSQIDVVRDASPLRLVGVLYVCWCSGIYVRNANRLPRP